MRQANLSPPQPTPAHSPARERLLRRASELFYAEGIGAVGVDRVVHESAVTRATFYRHFPSKELLVVAYLQGTDRAVRDRFAELERDCDTPAELLRAVAREIGATICAAGFRGCPFINAAAEFPDPQAPVRLAVADHRDWLFAFFESAFVRAGHPLPAAAARALIMQRDGACVAGYLASPEDARRDLLDGVEALLHGLDRTDPVA